MSTQIRRHHQTTILCLVTLAILSGCSGRRVTSGVEDQTFTPGAPPPAPVEEAKAPPPPEGSPESQQVEPSAATSEPPAPAAEPPKMEAPPVPAEEPQVQAPEEKPRVEDLRAEAQSIAPTPEPKPALPPAEPVADLSDVFFEFDEAIVRDDARSVLEANAKVLKALPGTKVVIEGHCDERGTSAYNLVLGERRAQSVKRYLQNLGIPPSEIQITSYGKERPFCSEHTEDCWQSNRRAHFRKP